jgi:hypothetical protein
MQASHPIEIDLSKPFTLYAVCHECSNPPPAPMFSRMRACGACGGIGGRQQAFATLDALKAYVEAL